MRYDIVLVGYRLNASLKPAQALHEVLGLDLELCRQLTRQFPATVLSGASQSRAKRVSDELTELGAKVEVRESRLSHASEPSSGHPGPFPANEESGNYEIGEILAPLAKGSLAPAGDEGSPIKRPSREELDEALRESFRPLRSAPPPPISVAPPALELEEHGAFAGLQSFDDALGSHDLPALEIEENALRAIQRSSDSAPRAPAPPSRWERLMRLLSRMSGGSVEWLVGLLWLVVVAAITLLAVGYAFDPADALGLLRRG